MVITNKNESQGLSKINLKWQTWISWEAIAESFINKHIHAEINMRLRNDNRLGFGQAKSYKDKFILYIIEDRVECNKLK